MGVINSLKYCMLSNITLKLILHDVDIALDLPTHLDSYIAPKMINDYVFVYSLVSIASTLDCNFHTT